MNAKYFIEGSIHQIKKVVWPERKQIIGLSSLVLFLTLLFAVFFVLSDSIIDFILGLVLG